jgi:hypothetical protein
MSVELELLQRRNLDYYYADDGVDDVYNVPCVKEMKRKHFYDLSDIDYPRVAS